MIDMEQTFPHGSYPKIDTIWKRVPKGEVHAGSIIVGDWSTPEFEYLAQNEWIGTEKVDGTNIRVQYWGAIPHRARFFARDAGLVPPKLESKLQDIFWGEERMAAATKQFAGAWADDQCVTLYGEGYGAGIQKGGKYIPNGCDFVLFDVAIGDWWLKREAVEEIAHNLRIDVAPITFRGTLYDACHAVGLGMPSTWGNFEAEGLVLQPRTQMFTRQGKRIITKIKTKDYLRFVTPYGLSEPRSAKKETYAAVSGKIREDVAAGKVTLETLFLNKEEYAKALADGLADIRAGRTTPWSVMKEELALEPTLT